MITVNAKIIFESIENIMIKRPILDWIRKLPTSCSFMMWSQAVVSCCAAANRGARDWFNIQIAPIVQRCRHPVFGLKKIWIRCDKKKRFIKCFACHPCYIFFQIKYGHLLHFNLKSVQCKKLFQDRGPLKLTILALCNPSHEDRDILSHHISDSAPIAQQKHSAPAPMRHLCKETISLFKYDCFILYKLKVCLKF